MMRDEDDFNGCLGVRWNGGEEFKGVPEAENDRPSRAEAEYDGRDDDGPAEWSRIRAACTMAPWHYMIPNCVHCDYTIMRADGTHAFLASPASEIGYCMGPGTRGFGVCGEYPEHSIHTGVSHG